ncbi:hypothetical protein QPR87_02330 [Paracoccus sp. SSJ]|nr:hypothetical protein [Paracoccus sp. SSJ]
MEHTTEPRWSYTKVYKTDGEWIANCWTVSRDRQPVGRVSYNTHSGKHSYIWHIDSSGAYGSSKNLEDALNALRDTLNASLV